MIFVTNNVKPVAEMVAAISLARGKRPRNGLAISAARGKIFAQNARTTKTKRMKRDKRNEALAPPVKAV